MEFNYIRDLRVGSANINLNFIVLEVGRPTTTSKGHEIRSCRVADRSGCIQFSVRGELGNYLQPGDICRLMKGYVSTYKGASVLYVGKGGELVKTGEFCMIFNDQNNMSDPAQALAQNPATTNPVSNIKTDNESTPPITTAE